MAQEKLLNINEEEIMELIHNGIHNFK